MKLSKETRDRMSRFEVKVVLPKLTMNKPPTNCLFKRKKSKRVSSSGSDKENRILSLSPIDKAFDEDLRNRHSKRLKLSEEDQRLLLDTFKDKRKSTKYSKVDSFEIKSSANRSNEIVSRSQSIKVSRSTTAVEGTSYNFDKFEINPTSSNPKHRDEKSKRDKCLRKDSGIDVEYPRRNRSAKRKFSEFSNDAPNGISETELMNNEVPITDSSNEIHDFIQSYSSHKCTDKIDRKIGNVETLRSSESSFVCNDFVIRIQQCCFNRPSKDSTPGCTTSVVAISTKCENIKENEKKICRNVAVEKRIGISTHVKIGDDEKNCTRIVQSKFVQTTKQSHKKIKRTEPSRMVTRRKAASNLELEFYKLINEKNCEFIVNSDIPKTQSDRCNKNKENDAGFKKKFNSHKKIISKGKNYTEVQCQNLAFFSNNSEESMASCNQSDHLWSKTEVAISEKLNTTAVDSKKKIVSKRVKEVSIHREETLKPSTSQVIQKAKTELQKLSRTRKLCVNLSDVDDGDSSLTWEPTYSYHRNVKQLNSSSCTENGEKQDAKFSMKLRDSKRKKNAELEAPKKSSLPAKRLMKKSEALGKTERYNEQRKKLKNDGKKTLQKTVSLTNSALPRRITRFSSKTQNNSFAASISKHDVAGTSCVTFSSKTPETIRRLKNEKRNDRNSISTPYILLDRLDANDISTYAITPLREDRKPLPSKSYDDYGIDDINTDDSTDEEDCPKKVVPQWARSLGHKPTVQFYFPRETIMNWIRPPTDRLTIESLFS